MDALDKKYNINLIKERVEALRKFKEEVSVHSLNYAKFESDQQPKLKNVPVFARGLKFYNELNVKLISELESEIKRTEREIDGIQSLKEAKIKQIISLFEMTTQSTSQFKKLEAAVATMHDMPAFGA